METSPETAELVRRAEAIGDRLRERRQAYRERDFAVSQARLAEMEDTDPA